MARGEGVKRNRVGIQNWILVKMKDFVSKSIVKFRWLVGMSNRWTIWGLKAKVLVVAQISSGVRSETPLKTVTGYKILNPLWTEVRSELWFRNSSLKRNRLQNSWPTMDWVRNNFVSGYVLGGVVRRFWTHPGVRNFVSGYVLVGVVRRFWTHPCLRLTNSRDESRKKGYKLMFLKLYSTFKAMYRGL